MTTSQHSTDQVEIKRGTQQKLGAAKQRTRMLVSALVLVLLVVGVSIVLMAVFGVGAIGGDRPSESVAIPWQKQD